MARPLDAHNAQNTVDKSFGEWEDAGFWFSRRTALGKPSRIELKGPLGFGGAYKGLGEELLLYRGR